jgi:hypothetical protein
MKFTGFPFCMAVALSYQSFLYYVEMSGLACSIAVFHYEYSNSHTRTRDIH